MKAVKLLLIFVALVTVNMLQSQNCTVNAGIDQTVCTSSATLVGAQPENRATIWTQVAGPTSIITDQSAKTTTVTGLIGGNSYKFSISTVCTDGLTASDTVTITAQNFPITSAGSGITICTGTNTATLAASPLQSGETGVWTFVSTGTSASTGGLTINSPTSPTSTLTLATGVSNSGNVSLRWTVTKTASGCTAFSDVVVTKIAVNPVVSAGTNITVSNCYTSTASTVLAASFAGGGTYGRWSVVSGPNTPSFSNVNAHNATASGLIEGAYVLRWTVTTPCFSTTSSDVNVLVGAPRGAVSTATASIVGSPSMPFCEIPTEISVVGSVYNMDTERVLWTITSGSATIANPTSRNTTISGFNGTTVVLRYTITNIATNCSTQSSALNITFESSQTLSITNSKPLLLACNSSSTTINISQTGTATPQWSVVSGPAGFTPTAYTNISGNWFTVTNLNVQGTYIIRVRKVLGTCSTIFDDIAVHVSRSPSASNAGSDPTLACNATQATLIGNTPTAGLGKWSQVSGPNTATIVSANTAQTNVTNLISGIYTFRWTITNGPNCPSTQDDVRVRVASQNPTQSYAGEDQEICNTSPLYLNGNIPLSNETGTWSVIPSAGVVFSNRNNPKAVVTGLAALTTYTFAWTISNNCSNSTDHVVVRTSEIAGPIAALAGNDQCHLSGTTSITMAANSPSAGFGTWTKLTGGAATITNPASNTTTITGLENGIYTFEWAITRNACTITRDTITVTISANASTANAGPDQLSVCGSTTTLAANTPTVGLGKWTQVGGLGGAVITNPNNPNSTVTNLGDGQYTFRWTITNGSCSSNSDDVIIFASSPPTTPNAGTDKTVCASTSVAMTANTIANGSGYWNIVNGPNSPTIASNTAPNTLVSGLVTGTYRLTWNSSNGLCTVLSDEVIITVVPAASAGSNHTLCGTTTTSLKGNENTTGIWTIAAITPTQEVSTEVLTPTSDFMATASGLKPGFIYTFKYTLTNADACATSKESTVTVTVLNTPTAARAGDDQEICINTANTTITLNGNAATIGTGIWTRTLGTGTITNATNNQTTVTGVAPGMNVFTWTISNGSCTSTDQVVIKISRVEERSAGFDQSVCGSTATLAAQSPSSGVGVWSVISGPNSPNFSSFISNTATLTNLIQGIYVFRWTIVDGNCVSSFDEMTLIVNTAPTTPNAGLDQELCNVTTTTLTGNTISVGSGTWSKVSGPSCTITNPANPQTTITGLTPGTYVFRWTASNGTCTDLTDEVTITINQPLTIANAGADLRICLYTTFNLQANTPTVGTGQWSQVSGSSTVNFTNAASPTTTITGAIPGNYTFRWTISHSSCTSSFDDVNLIIDELATTANAGDDIVTNSLSVILTGNTINSGTGTWSKVSGPIGGTIANANSPTTTISNLSPGTFVYRWTAVNGTCISSDEVQIIMSEKQTFDIVASETFTTCVISWSNGSRTSRVVFLTEGTGHASNPTNGTTYSASTNWFEKGTQLGSSGYFCIYNGSGTSVRVTGLYPGRTYRVRAFEYNGVAGNENYLTNLVGTKNPINFIPWPNTTFSNSPGISTPESWDQSARWNRDTIPSTNLHEAVQIIIDGNCIVNSEVSCYNLRINPNRVGVSPRLTINAGSSLHVVGGALGGSFLNAGDVNSLVVKASSTQPNATLIWKNGNPIGSVEMYSKASWDLSKPVNNRYKWQFIGIPVKSTTFGATFNNCFLREWDESVTRFEDVWARRNDGTSLQKRGNDMLFNHRGYELVQQFPTTYTFKGTLENNDFEQPLPFTPTAYFKGQHIFGNPYTAAIDIRSIEFGENTEQTVYQYNSGTFTDWIDNEGENVGIDGIEITPGRYSVSTKNTAGILGILRQIPSMQGFLVKSTNEQGGSIRIPYPARMKNQIQQRVKRESKNSIVATRIDVRGSSFSDVMWFFVGSGLSRNYDNGWDGYKILGDPAVTQIYGIESNNTLYAINGVNDLNNSMIGFRPGNDKNFVMKFTHQNINSIYNSLYLIDMVTNNTVNVLNSGTEYAFTSTANDPIERFKLVTNAPTVTGQRPSSIDHTTDVFKMNNKIVVNNRNNFEAVVKIYDEIGRNLTNETVHVNSQKIFDLSLVRGVYIVFVKVDGHTLTQKIIMN